MIRCVAFMIGFFGNLCCMTMPTLQSGVPAFIPTVKGGLARISQPSDYRIYRSQPLILFQRNFFLFFRIHFVRTPVSRYLIALRNLPYPNVPILGKHFIIFSVPLPCQNNLTNPIRNDSLSTLRIIVQQRFKHLHDLRTGKLRDLQLRAVELAGGVALAHERNVKRPRYEP